MTARDAAKDLIKLYVLRGDDPESLAAFYLGACTPEYWASIGGATNNFAKHYAKDKIVVNELAGHVVDAVFSFREIYDEIKRGTSQPALF